jgi:hypothetical protein
LLEPDSEGEGRIRDGIKGNNVGRWDACNGAEKERDEEDISYVPPSAFRYGLGWHDQKVVLARGSGGGVEATASPIAY